MDETLLESIINDNHVDFDDGDEIPTEPEVDLSTIHKPNNVWPALGTLEGLDELLAWIHGPCFHKHFLSYYCTAYLLLQIEAMNEGVNPCPDELHSVQSLLVAAEHNTDGQFLSLYREGGKGHPIKETQQARLHSCEGLPGD